MTFFFAVADINSSSNYCNLPAHLHLFWSKTVRNPSLFRGGSFFRNENPPPSTLMKTPPPKVGGFCNPPKPPTPHFFRGGGFFQKTKTPHPPLWWKTPQKWGVLGGFCNPFFEWGVPRDTPGFNALFVFTPSKLWIRSTWFCRKEEPFNET